MLILLGVAFFEFDGRFWSNQSKLMGPFDLEDSLGWI